MNNFMGPSPGQIAQNPEWLGTRGGKTFTLFLKSTDFTKMSASQCWVFLDENPASINDGFFEVEPDLTVSQYGDDRPAVNHGESSSFSYADGHAELKKWMDCFAADPTPPGSANSDNVWLGVHSTCLP
jgi:prepilin-type processing-associated H-X9-DG protein